MRKILDSNTTKEVALRVISEIAAPVKMTLGPGGLPIIIQQNGQNPDGSELGPLITKDGVTVAQSISFRNSAKKTLAQAIIQIASNTVNTAGDGPQDLNSKILTPNGFVRMGDIKVGDTISGTNGTKQTVLGVFPKGKLEMYEVSLSGGGVVRCSLDHLWSVTTSQGVSKVVPLSNLVKDYNKVNSDGTISHKYFIQTTHVEFNENKEAMLLDPYLVGTLLGDGSLTGTGSIELSLGKAKEHIIAKLKLPEGFSTSINYCEARNYYRVKLKGVDKNGRTMKDMVEAIGLLGVGSKTKFIPKAYLYSSRESREALLQGLIDTDGHNLEFGTFEYSSVSKRLADDFADLCRSLGKQISVSQRQRQIGKSYSESIIYRIKERKGYNYGNKIIGIKSTKEIVPMQCIKVSNSDHLYITDDYVVTHNTSSSIVLAEAILIAGHKLLKQGENGIQLYNRLKEVKDEVIAKLTAIRKEITEEDIYDVALISANGDEEVASVVQEAILSVGEDGHIDLQEGYSKDTSLNIVEGAVYKQGWRKFGPLGALMINDKTRNVCELERPAVVLYAGDIREVQEISQVVAKIMGISGDNVPQSIIPILFIAYDFSDDVKNHIMQLRIQGKLPVAAIKAPFDGSPNARTQMLEDLAVLLGGQVTARGIIDLKDITDEHLGCADKIEIFAEEIAFHKGQGSQEAIMDRVNELKSQMETVGYEMDKANLRLRIGKLTGGIAVLKVGGDSELEMRERKDRIEDALCAAKVALAEGIIPGGGYALYKIAMEMDGSDLAANIMREALKAPIRQIITNIGKSADVVLAQMPEGLGYDARNKEYVDLMEAGIVDPLKVTKSALENAVSIAGLLLTVGGSIVADQDSRDGTPNPLAGLMGGH